MVGFKRCMVPLCLTMATLVLLADAGNFCNTALNKKLCEDVVKGATDWNQAMTKAVTAAMSQLAKVSNSNFKTSIHKTQSAAAGNSVDKMCTEAYGNTMDRLKESMELIRSGDKDGSLNFKLSAALTSLEDCTNALNDFKVDMSSVLSANREVSQYIRVCLAVDKSKSAQ